MLDIILAVWLFLGLLGNVIGFIRQPLDTIRLTDVLSMFLLVVSGLFGLILILKATGVEINPILWKRKT